MKPRVFLGCAAYRSIEPLTAAAREHFLWDCLAPPGPGAGAAGPAGPSFELVGSAIAEGYGACGNVETLADAARLAGADFFVYHDADVRFTAKDVGSLLRRCELHAPCVAGCLYPSSGEDGRYVGRLVDVPLGDDRLDATPREFVLAHAGQAMEAESLGFGLVAIPMELVARLKKERGYAFAERSLGRTATTPDSEFCGAAKLMGYSLVADLSVKILHLGRTWRST
jgi:hypothetical protein